MSESNRAAIYARYSSEKQNALSIDQQVRKCREDAKTRGLCVPDEHIYSDEAVSGATHDRPALSHLLLAAKRNPQPFTTILIDDTSRLSRCIADSSRIYDQLRYLGIRVVFVSQNIDTNNEQSDVLLGIHGIVDQIYLQDLRKRTRRGMEELAIKGLHTGGRVFGYRNVPIESANEWDAHGRPEILGVRLEVEPKEAETVKRIFERCVAGHGMKRIAIDLNDEGILSPQPQKGRVSRSWCQSSVHHILHNERYRGVVIWGKTRKLLSTETRKRIYRKKPQSEWHRKEIPAQRIISDQLWAAAQDRLRLMHGLYGEGSKNGIRGGRAAGSPYLFTGLLKCSVCEGSVTIVSGKSGKRQDSRYGCSMHAYRGSKVCENNLLIFRRSLEEQLLAGLQAKVFHPDVMKYTLRRFEEELTKIVDSRKTEVSSSVQRKLTIEQQIANCANAIAEGQPSKSLTAKLRELELELEILAHRIDNERPETSRSRAFDVRKFVEVRLRDLRASLNSEPGIARAAIAKHVEKIKLTPDGRIYMASGTWDLLGLGCYDGAGGTACTVLPQVNFLVAA